MSPSPVHLMLIMCHSLTRCGCVASKLSSCLVRFTLLGLLMSRCHRCVYFFTRTELCCAAHDTMMSLEWTNVVGYFIISVCTHTLSPDVTQCLSWALVALMIGHKHELCHLHTDRNLGLKSRNMMYYCCDTCKNLLGQDCSAWRMC